VIARPSFLIRYYRNNYLESNRRSRTNICNSAMFVVKPFGPKMPLLAVTTLVYQTSNHEPLAVANSDFDAFKPHGDSTKYYAPTIQGRTTTCETMIDWATQRFATPTARVPARLRSSECAMSCLRQSSCRAGGHGFPSITLWISMVH
jgi:hypothetical protein